MTLKTVPSRHALLSVWASHSHNLYYLQQIDIRNSRLGDLKQTNKPKAFPLLRKDGPIVKYRHGDTCKKLMVMEVNRPIS